MARAPRAPRAADARGAQPAAALELERFLEALTPLLASASLAELLERALVIFAQLAEPVAAAIFVTDGQSVVGEAWEPADEARRARLRPHFLGLHQQSVKTGEVVAVPFPSDTANELEPHVFLLRARGRTLGTVCCARTPGDDAAWVARAARVERFVALLADLIATTQESASWRATRAQYERWFRQLDQHIRVLDRERQKFAALVNQSDVSVFVTDANRVIRWANRAVALRFPIADGAPSWIGRNCMELCALLGEGHQGPGCLVARALEENRPVHLEYRRPSDHGERIIYATALPIKGPEGKPHEVIVTLQDLSELDTVRKSEARYRELLEDRRKADEAITRLETRLSAVVASSPIVLFSIDRDGIITLSEGRGLEGLGHKPGETVGCSVYELYRDYPEVGAQIRRALRGEEFTATVTVGARVFETRYAPMRADDGTITGVLGVATDVTASHLGEGARTLDRAA
jgi:PAS domain S-box-containing protein